MISISFEARPVWRKVADLSLRLGQIDQATGVPCSVTMAGNRSNVLDDDGGYPHGIGKLHMVLS